MFVVDLHALQPIDVLDLLHQIDRKLLHAFDAQDVVRGRIAFDDVIAFLDVIAFAHTDVLALRDEILDRFTLVVLGLHNHAPLVLVVLAELNEAVRFGQDGAVFGLARLEQLRHARQAARDVACLGAFRRDSGEHVAGLHRCALFNRDDCVHR